MEKIKYFIWLLLASSCFGANGTKIGSIMESNYVIVAPVGFWSHQTNDPAFINAIVSLGGGGGIVYNITTNVTIVTGGTNGNGLIYNFSTNFVVTSATNIELLVIPLTPPAVTNLMNTYSNSLRTFSITITNGYPWGSLYQPTNNNLTGWSAIAPSSKQNTLTYTPQPASDNLTNWSGLLTNQVARTNLSSASVTGILSSGDWSAFNAKQSALGFTPLTPVQTTNAAQTVVSNMTAVIGDNLSSPTNLTVGASPYNYTNTYSVMESLYVGGGNVSDISIMGTTTGLTNGLFILQTNEYITTTYSSVPTVKRKAIFK